MLWKNFEMDGFILSYPGVADGSTPSRFALTNCRSFTNQRATKQTRPESFYDNIIDGQIQRSPDNEIKLQSRLMATAFSQTG